jgi:hypothetical protein
MKILIYEFFEALFNLFEYFGKDLKKLPTKQSVALLKEAIHKRMSKEGIEENEDNDINDLLTHLNDLIKNVYP